ncbi:MAG TPA: hypothetical protein VK488_04685 [Gaiellaceae bacterium]|nr:hypothetical protein [Gaiellaceae bacterium]
MVGRSSRSPVAGVWLLALVAALLTGGLGRCSPYPDVDAAVARGSGDSPLTVYVSACGRSGSHVVSLSENVGGSRTTWGVPIYWEIVSRAGSRRAVYEVGRAPPGFVTSVPLLERVASGRGDFYEIDIDGFPAGSFTLSDLPKARGVSGECRTHDDAGERWLTRLLSGVFTGIAFLVVIWIVLKVQRRFWPAILDPARRVRRQTVAAALATGVAVVALLAARGEPHQPALPLPRGVPNPGPLFPSLRAGQHVLVKFDSTEASRGPLATTQFTARARYVMYVGCSGTSVQVSEGFDTPDVGYGARTVAFCNPTVPVPSALDVSPKGAVTLGVVPNGTRRWRVTVATP